MKILHMEIVETTVSLVWIKSGE